MWLLFARCRVHYYFSMCPPPPPNINNYNAFIVEWARIDVFTSIDLLIEMTKFNDTNQRLFTLMYTVRRSRWEGGGVGWGEVG